MSKPIASLNLYAIVNVKVRPRDGSATDPQKLIDEVFNRNDFHELLGRTRGLPAEIEYIEYGEDFTGALIDYEGDEEYEHSDYVTSGTVSQNIEPEVNDALSTLLASGQAPLAQLRVVFKSHDMNLFRSAGKGIVRHPDSTAEERAAVVRRLAEDHPYILFSWLEEDADARARLSLSDLQPALELPNSADRERALRLVGTMGREAALNEVNNRSAAPRGR